MSRANGAAVDAIDSVGDTAMHKAATHGRVELMEVTQPSCLSLQLPMRRIVLVFVRENLEEEFVSHKRCRRLTVA